MYVGGTLEPMFSPVPARVALLEMAHKGGDRMVELTIENTPIASGNLRTSWYQRRVRRVRGSATFTGPRGGVLQGWESGVATDVEYAPHVEFGTGLWGPDHAPYIITPKAPNGLLHWRDPLTGHWISARRVEHPGSPGQHMVQIAAGAVEIEMVDGALFDSILAEWVRTQEALV